MNGTTGEHFEADNGFQHEQQQGGPWAFESNGQQGVFVAGDMDGSAFPEGQFQPLHQELVSGIGTQYPIDINGYGSSAPYYNIPQGERFEQRQEDHLASFYQEFGVLQSQELPAEGSFQLIGSHNDASFAVPVEVDTPAPSLCNSETGESEESRPRRSPRPSANSDNVDSNPLYAPPTPTDPIPIPRGKSQLLPLPPAKKLKINPAEPRQLQSRSEARKQAETCICPYPECAGKTFTRKGDLDRHSNGRHNKASVLYFCVHCEERNPNSRHSFHRTDKLKDHHEKHHKPAGLKLKVREEKKDVSPSERSP